MRPTSSELDARKAERAQRLYGLLVIPGLELTCDDPDPGRAAHALALGLQSFVGVAEGLEPALRAARAQGAALVAAHPYSPGDAPGALRPTAAFATDTERLAPLVDRFELFNRETVFPWVAEAALPAVACGDFHTPAHLETWKTLLPCAKDERSVVDYLRSPRPAFLVRLEHAGAKLGSRGRGLRGAAATTRWCTPASSSSVGQPPAEPPGLARPRSRVGQVPILSSRYQPCMMPGDTGQPEGLERTGTASRRGQGSGFRHDECVEYANLRFVEEQNRASLRARGAAGRPSLAAVPAAIGRLSCPGQRPADSSIDTPRRSGSCEHRRERA